MNSVPMELARLAAEEGGRAYYVGGCVRDRLLGRGSKDIDIEVHGIGPEALFELLKKIGEPLSYGESFGIYSLKGLDIDIAMPRTEAKTGRGHKDFQVCVDPFIGTREAARRRDFTVNALMEDILTGEIIDHFGGMQDLQSKVLRHVDDESFPEDPLRVLRGAQFASRFGFSVAPETMALFRQIPLDSLSRERVEEELKKALLQGVQPSIFFEVLREADALDVWFPLLKKLLFVEQDPIFHPEGNVWIHTMEVLDRGAACRDKVSDPYSFGLLCLAHDLGKLVTTAVGKDGRIHAYGHETEGLPLIEEFLGKLTAETRVKGYVLNMTALHMKPNVIAYRKSAVKTTNKMFDDAASPADLIYFALADRPVVSGTERFTGDSRFLFERLAVYEETMSRPYVKGSDLIKAGLKPGPDFSGYLEFAHKLRLAGIEKESVLKQTLAMAGKAIKKENHGKQQNKSGDQNGKETGRK